MSPAQDRRRHHPRHEDGRNPERRRRGRRPVRIQAAHPAGRVSGRRAAEPDHRPGPDRTRRAGARDGRGGLLHRPAKPRAQAARVIRRPRRLSGERAASTGILPGTACEPKMTTVGSQDTTGPDDGRRAQGAGLPRIPGGSLHAVVLPHGGLPKAADVKMHQASQVRHRPQGRRPQAGRRDHPLLAQPVSPSRHDGNGRRFPHPLSRSGSASRPAPGSWPLPGPSASCPWTCRSRCWSDSRDSSTRA